MHDDTSAWVRGVFTHFIADCPSAHDIPGVWLFQSFLFCVGLRSVVEDGGGGEGGEGGGGGVAYIHG